MLNKNPDWLREPDIRTYSIRPYQMDYIIDSIHLIKNGYLLELYKNAKIRRTHFFTNKRNANKYGKDYMKNKD